MVRTRSERAPAFGVQTQRFQPVGYHPGLDKRSATVNLPDIGPGCYHKVKAKPLSKSKWTKGLEDEEFSKKLGFCPEYILKERKVLKEINGPGWNTGHFTDNQVKGYTFPKGDRFGQIRKGSYPGPGTYDKHTSDQLSKETDKIKGFSFLPFASDRDPRGTKECRPYHLPPNLYDKDSFVEKLLSKVTSVRGPYDLFTGPRDESTLYGFLRASLDKKVDKIYDLPTSIDQFNLPENKAKGKFLHCGRDVFPPMRHIIMDPALCKKDPEAPGPDCYNLRSEKTPSQNLFPFNSSTLYARPPIKIVLKPPPGRYFPDKTRRIPGGGARSCFLSKVKQGLPAAKNNFSWFD